MSMKKLFSVIFILIFSTCLFAQENYSEFLLFYRYQLNEKLDLNLDGEKIAEYESGSVPIGMGFMGNFPFASAGPFNFGMNLGFGFDYSYNSKCTYNQKEYKGSDMSMDLGLGPMLLFSPFNRHSLGISPAIKGTMLVPLSSDFASITYYLSFDTSAYYEFYFSKNYNKGFVVGVNYSIPLFGAFGTQIPNSTNQRNYSSKNNTKDLGISPTTGDWQIFAGFTFGWGQRRKIKTTKKQTKNTQEASKDSEKTTRKRTDSKPTENQPLQKDNPVQEDVLQPEQKVEQKAPEPSAESIPESLFKQLANYMQKKK